MVGKTEKLRDAYGIVRKGPKSRKSLVGESRKLSRAKEQFEALKEKYPESTLIMFKATFIDVYRPI